MPTLLDFISRVLPWAAPGNPGVADLVWKKKDGKWGGRPVHTPADFVSLTDWCLKRPGAIADLYFCLSLQAQMGTNARGKPKMIRSSANALALKAIWLDVDVKEAPKGYPTLTDAVKAVNEFVQKSGLPSPNALVASGGGLHVYWISTKELTPEEWQPYADGLKALAIKHGLRCDYGVTTDRARILRIPGTLNHKTTPPKPVKLLALDPDYDFATMLSMLPGVAPAVVTTAVTPAGHFDLRNFEGKTPSQVFTNLKSESLSEGIKNELPPLDPTEIFKGCGFFRDALNTHGKEHTQPLWNLVILATTFWQNGKNFAHALGSEHPGYTPASTEAMYERKAAERERTGIGWPSCKGIEGEGSKFCHTCPYYNKIKSPLNLALVRPTPPPTIHPQALATSTAAQKLTLPPGYGVDPNTGYIGELIAKPAGKGKPPEDDFLPLFKCVISKPWAERSPDALHFTATADKGSTVEASIKLVEITETRACIVTLAGQCVMVNLQAKERVPIFMNSWLNQLFLEQAAARAIPFGWWYDHTKPGSALPDGFAYGGKIVRSNQKVDPAGYPDPSLKERYEPTGTREPWIKALKMITDQHRPQLETLVATAFAGPIMQFTGEYNATYSGWGKSGGGKSTALKIAMSVWGNPKLTKETAGSTSKSVLHKMGQMRNIPIYWDEISDKHVQDHVYKTIMAAGEGVEGGRLHQNVTQRARGDWQTALVACSNLSMYDFLSEQQKSTDAGLNRVFEFYIEAMDPKSLDTDRSYDIALLVQQLERNYGVIGAEYAQLLGLYPQSVKDIVHKWMDVISSHVNPTRPERFWIASAASIMAGASLANNLNGVHFNLDELFPFIIDAFKTTRARTAQAGTQGGSEANTSTHLLNWLRHTIGNSIWTTEIPVGRGKPKQVQIVFGPDRKFLKPIYNHWGVNNRMLRISRSNFTEYMSSKNVSVQPMLDGLKNYFGAEFTRATIGSGTFYELQREPIIQIEIPPGSPLEGMLYSQSPDDQKPKSVQTASEVVYTDEVKTGSGETDTAMAAAMRQAEADLKTVKGGT